MKSPSEKQISFVDAIAKTLGIDFPQCSSDFTARNYYYFIQRHIEEYNEMVYVEPDEDYLYAICANDIWCEHY